MKPTTYDVPAEAFRRDRQPAGAAEIEPRDRQPAPVSDHETIERRLARLEAAVHELRAIIASLGVDPETTKVRIAPGKD